MENKPFKQYIVKYLDDNGITYTMGRDGLWYMATNFPKIFNNPSIAKQTALGTWKSVIGNSANNIQVIQVKR